ncbi:MAG TPA: hypothetical protein VHC90_02760 [Bryobacteraceae bacterium]|nr:hypothetical protein [Bryobacteraceae bacterium]
MKKRIVLTLMAASAVLPLLADAPSLTGKWNIHTSIAGNESDMICAFEQKDMALTGKCQGQQGEVAITGKVDGNKVAFSYKSEYSGTPLTVAYEGTYDPEKGISGAVGVPEFSVDGDFYATSAK